jgi:N-acetylmuramoyl-L-alanine amidase
MQFGPVYRRGDRGPAVAEIRAKLAALGLLPQPETRARGVEDALFDDDCDRAVREFQQRRGLMVDGVVGAATYHALDEARWQWGDRVLSHSGSRMLVGDDVAALQQRLLDLGFDCGRVDGIFGRQTAQAVREFQRNVGIEPDGTCGPVTYAAFERLTRAVVGGQPYALRESELIHRAGPALSGKIVVIDPGHGARDHGLVGSLDPTHFTAETRVHESTVVFDLAARLEGRLSATGVTAYLTRGPDTDLSEDERADLANTLRANLLISLHVDAHPNPEASGVATFYYANATLGGSSPVGEKFAGLVQREIVARTDLRDCRIHGKTWDLLRRTRMPAVRIDVGYITNPDDARRLGSPQFRDVVAEAIAVAVQRLYLPPDLDAPTGALRLPVLSG